jgi:hypothetical protein
MKTSLLLIALLISATGFAGPNGGVGTASNPLYHTPSRYQQQQVDQANQQYQRQQIVIAAQKSAAQAAAYAKKVAPFNNEAAREAASYAEQAADHAKQAAYKLAYPLHIYNGPSASFEQEAAYTEQAAANAKRAAAQAETQAEIDSAVAKLENERDEAIVKAKAKFAPTIADLEAQLATLEKKANALEILKNSFFVTNHNVKPGPNYRVVNGETYNITNSGLWGSVIEEAGFAGVHQTDYLPVVYVARLNSIEANKILCDIYSQISWPGKEGTGSEFVETVVIFNYPDVGSLVTGKSIGDYACMKGGNCRIRNNSFRAFDCGVQSSQRVTEVVPGNPDAATLKKIEANQKELSTIESQLSQINSAFDKEKKPIIAEYDAKIKDVPTIVAQQAKEKEDAKKRAVTDRVLKSNQDAADKGDAYGLLRMGERYRDGEGVSKDLTKARDYLTKAAAAGSQTATDDLKILPANPNP